MSDEIALVANDSTPLHTAQTHSADHSYKSDQRDSRQNIRSTHVSQR